MLIVRADAKSPTLAAARLPGGAPIVLGGTGEGARDGDVPKILRDALGLNIRQVLGYPDSPSIFLAVERGEVDGRTFDLSSRAMLMKGGGRMYMQRDFLSVVAVRRHSF